MQTVAGQNDGDSVTLQESGIEQKQNWRSGDKTNKTGNRIGDSWPYRRRRVRRRWLGENFSPLSVFVQNGQNEPKPAQGAA